MWLLISRVDKICKFMYKYEIWVLVNVALDIKHATVPLWSDREQVLFWSMCVFSMRK